MRKTSEYIALEKIVNLENCNAVAKAIATKALESYAAYYVENDFNDTVCHVYNDVIGECDIDKIYNLQVTVTRILSALESVNVPDEDFISTLVKDLSDLLEELDNETYKLEQEEQNNGEISAQDEDIILDKF